MVFIDYQNVVFSAFTRFVAPGGGTSIPNLDPLAIGNLLVGRRREGGSLVGVRVYRGAPSSNHQPEASAVNQQQASRWTLDRRVEVIRRPLLYPRGWPDTPAREKGIDVSLAVDFVRLAIEGAYDVGILFSRDTDLLPALETVHELRLAHVEVASWQHTSRLEFARTLRPWCHHLGEADFKSVIDPAVYKRRMP